MESGVMVEGGFILAVGREGPSERRKRRRRVSKFKQWCVTVEGEFVVGVEEVGHGWSGRGKKRCLDEQSRWRAPVEKWHCSGRSQRPALQPPTLPHGDRRFARKKQDRENPDESRLYVCDRCHAEIRWGKKSLQYDGQYVDVLAVRGRSVEELERAYYAGVVNATWWCSRCHQRPGESLEACRVRLGAFELQRMERTQRHIDALRLRQERRRPWQR